MSYLTEVADEFVNTYRRPNERAVTMARMYAEEGMTLVEIASQYGISRQRVDQILKPFGIRAHYGRRKREERARVLREVHGQITRGHETLKEAAERLGYASADSLWHAFNDSGLHMPSRRVEARHGTVYMYSHRKCRCPACLQAIRDQRHEYVKRGPPNHGTPSSYTNYGCRCDECKAAARIYRRSLRARKRQGTPTD